MKSNNEERKQMQLKFAGLYIVSILLMLLTGIAFWKDFTRPAAPINKKEPGGNNAVMQKIVSSEALLQARLQPLQTLDAVYASFLEDSSKKESLDSLNQLIVKAEAAFEKSIDSMEESNSRIPATGSKNEAPIITQAFRAILENRRSINTFRTALRTEKLTFKDTQNAAQWQNELLKKNIRIEELENELKSLPRPIDAGNTVKTESSQKEEGLKVVVNAMEDRNRVLTNTVNALKQDNERLTNQLSQQHTTVVPTATNIADMKNKNAALATQLQDLNAELSFARIECNLSRADAKQIISNARQRKQLLTDALGTLTELSKSDNADVQQKAKEKIAELNRLATTLRD